MKRILTILLTAFTLSACAQIQNSLPANSRNYGSTTFIAPDGMLWYGTPPFKYRGVYPATKIDSLLALIPVFDASLYYTKVVSDARFVSLTETEDVGGSKTFTSQLNVSQSGNTSLALRRIGAGFTNYLDYYTDVTLWHRVGMRVASNDFEIRNVTANIAAINISASTGDIAIGTLTDGLVKSTSKVLSNAISGVDYVGLTGTGASGTWNINVLGNASTVTNGVYSTGSYADPSWLTSLAYGKLTGTPDLSGYELLSNKSTSTSLGTSNTLYPTQNAVKTYVDGLFAGYAKLTGDNVFTGGSFQTYLSPSGSSVGFNATSAVLTVQNADNIRFASLQSEGIDFKSNIVGSGYASFKTDNIVGGTIRTFQFPDASGTVALEGNTVNTTGNQTGILGNKTWDGAQTINNTLSFSQSGHTGYILNSVMKLTRSNGTYFEGSGQGIALLTNPTGGVALINADDLTVQRQYQLSDTNGTIMVLSTDTPPSTSSSTGKTGTVIISGGFRYECIATNSWVRSAVSTF